MEFGFSKMHGLGNDFVVIDAINQSIQLDPEATRTIADRRFGIGCDQILLIEKARSPGTDFFYRIYNADGSEVAQCGNGARCVAQFVRDQGLSSKKEIRVATNSGEMTLYLGADNQIRVNMGAPILNPALVPFISDQEQVNYTLELGSGEIEMSVVSMGNPHAVIRVDDLTTAPVANWGPKINSSSRFPQGANVGFMHIVDRQRIELRVFERGAGETLACGSGACAAVVAAQLRGLVAEQVTVALPGGELVVSWSGVGSPVWMTGPASHVFDGRISL